MNRRFYELPKSSSNETCASCRYRKATDTSSIQNNLFKNIIILDEVFQKDSFSLHNQLEYSVQYHNQHSHKFYCDTKWYQQATLKERLRK